LTVESFHDYGRLFYPLMLILFHDNNRPHTQCDVYCHRGITVNSLLSVEKVH